MKKFLITNKIYKKNKKDNIDKNFFIMIIIIKLYFLVLNKTFNKFYMKMFYELFLKDEALNLREYYTYRRFCNSQ